MSPEDNQTVGARVRALRKSRRMTQAQLAARAGLNRDTVVRLENGSRHSPGATVLRALADALGVTTDDLAGASPLAPPPDPWVVDVSLRLRALPAPLERHARRVIAELVAAFDAPMLGYLAQLQEVLNLEELTTDELRQLTDYALQLIHQGPAAGADVDAQVSGRQS